MRPNALRSPPIQPARDSRCTMCVYSCENTSRSQSSVLPIGLPGDGGRRCISIGVVRERRRPAVRQVGLVDEDHVHAAAGRTQSLVERRGNVLGDAPRGARERLFALVKVNVEARCGDRPEAQARIVASRRGSEDRRQAAEQNNQDQRASRHASRRRHLRADAAPALPPATPCPARERSFRNVKSAIGERRTP